MGVVLPMVSQKGEARQTARDINLLELTSAQQDRLPKLSQSLSPLPPTDLSEDLSEDLLANSPPPLWANNDTPSTSSSNLELPPSSRELPSLNLPPLPPIASYMDLSSLPPIISSEPILSELQIERTRPRQPVPSQINSGLPQYPGLANPISQGTGPRQLPLPPADRQIYQSGTSQLPLATDLQAYRPPGVNSPFSQLPEVEPSVIGPQEFPELSGRSEFEGLSVASAPRHLGPLPEKIPQQAIDELRRLQAQNRARNLEGTAAVRLRSPQAANIPTGTTVELRPPPEGQREIAAASQPEAAAGSTETGQKIPQQAAVPEKIPQQAIDELRRLQAQKRAELAVRSSDPQVAVAPLSSPPETAVAVPEKIPQQAIEQLRRLQAQKRAELAVRSSDPQVAVAPLSSPPETAVAVPEKIPQQAIEQLRRLQAQKRAELEASNDSQDQAATSLPSTTVESAPETVAAKPMVSAPEATPTEIDSKIPDRAIAQLRQLQQQFAYNPAGTTKAEALGNIQAWLSASQETASNPELLWEAKRITAEYPDAACRYGLDKNATDATVGVLVDPEGKISSPPDTIKSTGYALLNDIALEAASSYDFAAAGEYKAYLLEIKFSHGDGCASTAASSQ